VEKKFKVDICRVVGHEFPEFVNECQRCSFNRLKVYFNGKLLKLGEDYILNNETTINLTPRSSEGELKVATWHSDDFETTVCVHFIPSHVVSHISMSVGLIP